VHFGQIVLVEFIGPVLEELDAGGNVILLEEGFEGLLESVGFCRFEFGFDQRIEGCLLVVGEVLRVLEPDVSRLLEFGMLLNFRSAGLVYRFSKQGCDVESVMNDVGIRELGHCSIPKALSHIQAYRLDLVKFGNGREGFDCRLFVASKFHFQDPLCADIANHRRKLAAPLEPLLVYAHMMDLCQSAPSKAPFNRAVHHIVNLVSAQTQKTRRPNLALREFQNADRPVLQPMRHMGLRTRPRHVHLLDSMIFAVRTRHPRYDHRRKAHRVQVSPTTFGRMIVSQTLRSACRTTS
jgi:hypothetical protein